MPQPCHYFQIYSIISTWWNDPNLALPTKKRVQKSMKFYYTTQSVRTRSQAAPYVTQSCPSERDPAVSLDISIKRQCGHLGVVPRAGGAFHSSVPKSAQPAHIVLISNSKRGRKKPTATKKKIALILSTISRNKYGRVRHRPTRPRGLNPRLSYF